MKPEIEDAISRYYPEVTRHGREIHSVVMFRHQTNLQHVTRGLDCECGPELKKICPDCCKLPYGSPEQVNCAACRGFGAVIITDPKEVNTVDPIMVIHWPVELVSPGEDEAPPV